MTDGRDFPNPTSGDAIHTFAKAGLSAIPIIGGPAAELFAYVVVPPLTKRRDEWLKLIADGLKALEEKVESFSIESLSKNEEFVTMLLEASHIAVKNHQNEKIEALRNAVLNVALEIPEEHAQAIFLQFVAVATPWHFRVLTFYQSPEVYLEKAGIKLSNGDYLSHYVSSAFKELEGHDAFRSQIERDLLHYGLIFPEGEWYSKRTTNTGDKVLKLIASPI